MIGKMIERLFVQVRADLSGLSTDLSQGVAASRRATNQMAQQWTSLGSYVNAYGNQIQQLNTRMAAAAAASGAAMMPLRTQVASAFNTTPLVNFGRSVGQSRMQMMNLGYQINDIGMTLATGANPLTVMIQQGSQIAQIYGGQGGVRAAISDTSKLLVGLGSRLWPIALIAGGFAGLQHEINKTTDVGVTFGDTVGAVFEVLIRKLSFLQPAISKIKEWFDLAWNGVVSGVKWVGNAIIKGISIAVVHISGIVKSIPDMFLSAFSMAVSHVLTKMHDMVWHVGNAINQVAKGLNETFGTQLNTSNLNGMISALSKASGTYHQAGTAASDRIEAAADAARSDTQAIMASDPMGDFFNDVRVEAINNAQGRIAKGMEGIGSAAKGAGDKVKELVVEVEDGMKTAADNLAGVFGGLFEKLAEDSKLTFGDILKDINKLIAQSTSALIQSQLSTFFQGLGSGGGQTGGFFAGLFKSVFGGGSAAIGARAGGGIEMPWRNFVAGERGAELITQDGPAGARRISTAGRTRSMMGNDRPVSVTFVMPQGTDMTQFRKSQGQIGSMIAGAVSKGGRNR
jgi:hypothetical protein